MLFSNPIIIPINSKFNFTNTSSDILSEASPAGSNSTNNGALSPTSESFISAQNQINILDEKTTKNELISVESPSPISLANTELETKLNEANSSPKAKSSLKKRKISSSNCSTISSSTTNRPRSNNEKRRWEKPEVCLICSQPAQCLNFGAHCCHACRMFFRRSVLKFKDFHCKFEGNCDTAKGKNCRSCRFDACVLAQLDISLIQFPPDFNVPELKKRLEEKRMELKQKEEKERSQSTQSQQNSQQQESSTPKLAITSNLAIEMEKSFSTIFELIEFNKCLDHLLFAEKQAQKMRNSPNNLLLEYLCGKGLAEMLATQMNVLNFVELFTINGSPLKSDENSMMEANGIPFIGNYLNLDMLLQIELMRMLPMFEEIGIQDKIHLFQQNIHKLVTFSNGFYSFQQNAETIIYPNQIKPFNLCRRTLERNLQGEKLSRYLNLRRRAFCDVMDEFKAINLSIEEFVLLRAVIFCNIVPEQCSLETKMRLKTEAERYGKYLLRHLQMKNGEGNGARKYAECLLFATKIFDCNRRQNKFYELIEREAFGNKGLANYCSHPPFVLECLWRAEGNQQFGENKIPKMMDIM